jgi:hypothetical protein
VNSDGWWSFNSLVLVSVLSTSMLPDFSPSAITLMVTLGCFGFFEFKRASKSFSTGLEISGAVLKLSWVVTVSGVSRSCSDVTGLHELSSSNGNDVKFVLGKSTGSRSAGSAPKLRLLLR